MKSTWGEEYAEFGPYLEKFQNEVCEYVETLAKDSADTIHIANVYCRKSGIKTRESIMANQQAGKYDDMHSLLELRDVAGVRVTCHCEDDLINFSALLKGRLMQEYVFVDETKNALAQRTKDEPYRATHLVVGKETKKEGKVVMLYCEIQLRTVMGDAWAVQDHRYIYKRADKDGEDRELTMAVSEIMEWCEKLWGLVKKKSLGSEEAVLKTIVDIKAGNSINIETVTNPRPDLHAWVQSAKKEASVGLKKLWFSSFIEIEAFPIESGLETNLATLRTTAENSTIHTFGWPVWVVFNNREEFKPRPNNFWIFAEILIENSPDAQGVPQNRYDYWSLSRNGGIYLMSSLFEDNRRPGEIFFDTRIVRTTETLMYIRNVYTCLWLPVNKKIRVRIRYKGLHGRVLTAASPTRDLFYDRKIDSDEVDVFADMTIQEINDDMAASVKRFTDPFFELFEFFELSDEVLSQIVMNFQDGKIS